jgi:hypothetical protein
MRTSSGFLEIGLIREDPNPELSAALDLARDRPSRRLDLTRRHSAAA